MSLTSTTWAWSQGVAPSAKLVLLCLAEHADDGGHCWPSLRRIADLTGLSHATVTRCLTDLEASGLVVRNRGKGGQGRKTRYRLTVRDGAKPSHGETVEQSQDETVSGRNSFTMSEEQSHSDRQTVSQRDMNREEPSGSVRGSRKCDPFTRPTVDEVRAYCLEQGYSVDPQIWHDYYTSIGWKIGKNPMKDWKATVRNWESRQSKGVPTNEFRPSSRPL